VTCSSVKINTNRNCDIDTPEEPENEEIPSELRRKPFKFDVQTVLKLPYLYYLVRLLYYLHSSFCEFIRTLPFTQLYGGIEVFRANKGPPRHFASSSWKTVLISAMALFLTYTVALQRFSLVGRVIRSEEGFAPAPSYNESLKLNFTYE